MGGSRSDVCFRLSLVTHLAIVSSITMVHFFRDDRWGMRAFLLLVSVLFILAAIALFFGLFLRSERDRLIGDTGSVGARGWWMVTALVALFATSGVACFFNVTSTFGLRVLYALNVAWFGIDALALMIGIHWNRSRPENAQRRGSA
jgi:uncharacterized membrane protein